MIGRANLFYGPQFTDQYAGLDEEKPFVDDKPKYEKDPAKEKYVIVNDYSNAIQNYNRNHASLLPRMWSGEHALNYMRYCGLLDFSVKSEFKTQNEFQGLIQNFKNAVNVTAFGNAVVVVPVGSSTKRVTQYDTVFLIPYRFRTRSDSKTTIRTLKRLFPTPEQLFRTPFRNFVPVRRTLSR